MSIFISFKGSRIAHLFSLFGEGSGEEDSRTAALYTEGLHAASQSGQERRDQHRSQLSTSNAGRESDQGNDGGRDEISSRTDVPRLQ